MKRRKCVGGRDHCCAGLHLLLTQNSIQSPCGLSHSVYISASLDMIYHLFGLLLWWLCFVKVFCFQNAFLVDRKPVSEHLPLARSHSSNEDEQILVRKLEELRQKYAWEYPSEFFSCYMSHGFCCFQVCSTGVGMSFQGEQDSKDLPHLCLFPNTLTLYFKQQTCYGVHSSSMKKL